MTSIAIFSPCSDHRLLKEYIAENDFSEPLVLDNFTTQKTVIELYFGLSPSEGYIILVRDISQLKKT